MTALFVLFGRDVSLNEAAALLPSFLLPPQTDLSALPAAPVCEWHEDGTALVGSAAWGHSGSNAPRSSSHLPPLFSTALSYSGRSQSEYQINAARATPGGFLAGSADDVRVVSDAMGWRQPQHAHAHDMHKSCSSDDAYVHWGRPSGADGVGMWGGLFGDASSIWGGMGQGMGGGGEDGCELEVIAAARSLKQLLALPYSDQRVSLAVHRVGETLLIDQPPPATQSWGAGSKERRTNGTGGGMSGGKTSDSRGASYLDQEHDAFVEPSPCQSTSSAPPTPSDREEENARRRRKRSGKKNSKKQTLDLEQMLYSQLIAAGARGGSSSGLHLPFVQPAASDAPQHTAAAAEAAAAASEAATHDSHAAQSVLPSSAGIKAGVKAVDKWADAQWAHAHDSSDDDLEDADSAGVGGVGGHSGVDGGGQFAAWAPRMCRFQLGSMRMLLGSDVLVLDDPSSAQPCVSLYVRDPEAMSRCGFLDVWLDNVIASVPHVLMCWHKDAVIQGYMLKRTQDLPAISQFEFSPERIERCGSQVLKWLHTNCTSEASTYWLLKERGDERLQLYNLSALHQFTAGLGKSSADAQSSADSCGGSADSVDATDSAPGTTRAGQARVPERFAFPVAMLCIRAAARLSMQVTHEARARRRELLLQGASMLNQCDHASLLAHVHESIAETYVAIPVNLSPRMPGSAHVDRGLGCVESYPSLHAETFVLPCSDKRLDAQLAVEHLLHAITTLQLTLPSCSSASLPSLMVVLARVRRKAIECFAFLRSPLHSLCCCLPAADALCCVLHCEHVRGRVRICELV